MGVNVACSPPSLLSLAAPPPSAPPGVADEANPIICPDHFRSQAKLLLLHLFRLLVHLLLLLHLLQTLPETSPPTKLGTDSPWRIAKFPIYQFHRPNTSPHHPPPSSQYNFSLQFRFFPPCANRRLICILDFFSFRGHFSHQAPLYLCLALVALFPQLLSCSSWRRKIAKR